MKNSNVLINSDYGPMIININDSVIGQHIAKNGYWATSDINLIAELLRKILDKKSSVIFYDVGANIGTHSLALGKIFGGNIAIRAFEAQRRIYNMLCGTMALNGLDNVYCHHFAVDRAGGGAIDIALPCYDSKNNFGALELIAPLKSDMHDMKMGGHEVVPTIALDDYSECVDFIKLDIEGMEDRALMGAVNIFENSRPMCFIESHKTNYDFMIDFLSSRNYFLFKRSIDLIGIPREYGIGINGAERVV